MQEEPPEHFNFIKGRLVRQWYPIIYYGLTGTFLDKHNNQYTLKSGYLHSIDDMPSMIKNRICRWHNNGILHRVVMDKSGRQKPAILGLKGYRRYYIEGKLHRIPDKDGTNLPASIDKNGTKKWYHNGKLHRKDGPAIVHINGDYEWWYRGKLHRDDEGPALYYTDYNNCATYSIKIALGNFPCNFPDVKCNYYCEWRKHGIVYREKYPAAILDNCFEFYNNKEKTGIIFNNEYTNDRNPLPWHLRLSRNLKISKI